MATAKASWGLEVGAYGIKAIRLERDGDAARMTDFAFIPHKKVLTSPDLDQDEMIRLSLGQFVSQKSVEGERVAISIPGNQAFARFTKLPPVEPKKVPDIVKFEAVQQIPFPIDEVEWDYQTFERPDSPEIEVGIFAVTRERLEQRLSVYRELGINPDVITLSPLAVFNALAYDLQLAGTGKPTVFLDIGTTSTDLVVVDDNRCWIRTFPLGGHHFTEAISDQFKLSYGKGELLKQESATSKYAKQIMQAMRPVFGDLLADVQKSISYYQQLHRGAQIETMIGIGSTFKIPGLRKFLGQQLNLDVQRLDDFRRIRVEGREAADFAEHAVNMATAYGLALQGIGLGPVDINLTPKKVLREQVWAQKTKWFAAAAAIAVLASGALFIRGLLDRGALQSGAAAETSSLVENVLRQGKQFKSQYQALEAEGALGAGAETMRTLLDDRRVWPQIIDDVTASIASAGPQPALLGDSLDAIAAIPPGQRRAIQLDRLKGDYRFANGSRRIAVSMDVTFSNAGRETFLEDTVAKWLRENAVRPEAPYRIVPESISINTDKFRAVEINDQGRPAGSEPGRGDQAPQASDEQNPTAATGGGQGGGVSGPMGSGGIQGKRGIQGGGTQAPGSGLGFGGSDGTQFGGSGGGRDPDAGAGTDPDGKVNRTGREGGKSEGDDAEKFRLDELARIGDLPSLFKAGDKVFLALVTFEVELPAVAGGGGESAGGSE
jgi:type IV pilus assembly protein PilM